MILVSSSHDTSIVKPTRTSIVERDSSMVEYRGT